MDKELERLRTEVSIEVNRILLKKEVLTYEFGPDFNKVREKVEILINDPHVKNFICSGHFRTALDIADKITHFYHAHELGAAFFVGDPMTPIVIHAIALASCKLHLEIKLESYCNQ